MTIINTINLSWHDLFDRIPGIKTDVQNRLHIRREVVPIIFVPGIMGSRLRINKGKSKKNKAWDPDAGGFMLNNFGFAWVGAAKRKTLLVGKKFDAFYLEVDNDNPDHNKKFADVTDSSRAKRGWGGVYWDSYGSFLKELQSHQWPEPLSHCFEFPVHAFGYNWSTSCRDSGRKLREYIEQTIDCYRNGLKGETGERIPRMCEQVIIVTHSMGGLVARSACLLHGAKEKVLGIVHGVQPTTGSPAAYWRMKAGFERPAFSVEGSSWLRFFNPLKLVDAMGRKIIGNITAATLGSNGEEVTSLLANMPGGLQLLPNAQYLDNEGGREWLAYQKPDGTTLTLPKSDPYHEIYREQFAPWRMVNPDWIDPGQQDKSKKRYRGKSPWDGYEENVAEAEMFHALIAKLEKKAHEETVQFYSTGLASPDRVRYNRRPFEDHPNLDPWSNVALTRQFTNKGEFRGYVDQQDKPLPTSENATAIIALAMPDGSGDGTVPDSSGRALCLAPERTVTIGEEDSGWHESRFERGHEGIYRTHSAKEIVFRSVINFAFKRIDRVCKEKGYQSPVASG